MRKYCRLLGIVLFAFILYNIDISEVLTMIKIVQLEYVLFAMLLSVLVVIIKTIRWKYLLRMQEIQYGMKRALVAYFSSIFLASVTPGRIGDLTKTFYLTWDNKANYGKSLSSIIVDKIFDLLFLVLFVLGGTLFFTIPTSIKIAVILFSLSLLTVSTLIMKKNFISTQFLRFVRVLSPKHEKRLRMATDDFYDGIDSLNSLNLLLPALLSLFAYFVFFFQCYFISLALDISIPFFYLAFSISIANIIALIPVSVSGIGTRDAALILFFSFIGLSKEVAVSFSFLFLFSSLLLKDLIGGIVWIKEPVEIKGMWKKA